jgi:hypothetical protein
VKGLEAPLQNCSRKSHIGSSGPAENHYGGKEKRKIYLGLRQCGFITSLRAQRTHTRHPDPEGFDSKLATGGWRWGARRSYLFGLAWFDPPPLQIMRHLHSTQTHLSTCFASARAPPEGALSSGRERRMAPNAARALQ